MKHSIEINSIPKPYMQMTHACFKFVSVHADACISFYLFLFCSASGAPPFVSSNNAGVVSRVLIRSHESDMRVAFTWLKLDWVTCRELLLISTAATTNKNDIAITPYDRTLGPAHSTHVLTNLKKFLDQVIFFCILELNAIRQGCAN